MKNEIVLYQPNDLSTKIEVRVDAETVWLNRRQIANLFDRDVKTIGKHINNALKEELQGISTVAKFETVQTEGKRTVSRQIEFYNLDVVISVGYRVKSQRGIQFRIWANKILKDYLLRGYSLNNRINRIEENVFKLTDKIENIELQINSNLLPYKQGIFFNGQIFDSYKLTADIIRSAKSSIILIDNYVDDSVLMLFTKRKTKVSVTIYTKSISKILKQDLQKYNAQYQPIEIKQLKTAHDRFMIIDGNTVYHFGASLKDLGKKWFAFSKLEIDADDILEKL